MPSVSHRAPSPEPISDHLSGQSACEKFRSVSAFSRRSVSCRGPCADASRWDTAEVQINDLSDDVEAVSAFYAQRHSIQRTDDWFVLKLNEEVGELTQAYLARAGQARDKGRKSAELEQDFRSELADVLAQVLLIARRFNVDLTEEVERKWLVWKPSQQRIGYRTRPSNICVGSSACGPIIPAPKPLRGPPVIIWA